MAKNTTAPVAEGPNTCFINDLPDEILRYMFKYCLERPIERDRPAHVVLLEVCRRWHDLAMNDRHLWNTLYLTAEPPWRNDALLKQLERAAGADLAVVMEGFPEDCVTSTMWLKTNNLLDRVRDLECVTYSQDIAPVWELFGQFKNIKKLLIDKVTLDHDVFPILPDDIQIDLPQLRSLRLEYVNMPWNHTSFPALENLYLTIGTGFVGAAIQFLIRGLGNLPKLTNLMVVLDLQQLILYGDDKLEHNHIEKQSISVPNLRHLDLRGFFDYHLRMVVNAIRAPELRRFSAYGEEDRLTDRAWPDVDPRFPKLESLYLGGWHELGPLFTCFVNPSEGDPPPITYLNLVATDKTVPAGLVSAFQSLNLPHLKHLRTHDIPISSVRHMVESQSSVEVVGVEISDIGLGAGATEEAFRQLETDVAWMQQRVKLTVWGELYCRKLFGSWAHKLRNEVMVDTEAKHYEKWWHMESMD